jgi:hypothetical protein
MTSRPVPTKFVRQGVRFEPVHEQRLHQAAIDAAHVEARNAPLLLVAEMVAPLGIPDFSGLVGDTSKLDERLEAGLPPVRNRIDAALLASLAAGRPQSIERLSSQLGWPRPTLERRLDVLQRRGYVSAGRSGSFVRHASLQSLGKMIAVEAKIRDWRKALRQAHNYGVWADLSIVVLTDVPSASMTALKGEATELGLGVYVDNVRLTAPRLQHPSRAFRILAAECLVAAVD